jgi:hypothetical protein
MDVRIIRTKKKIIVVLMLIGTLALYQVEMNTNFPSCRLRLDRPCTTMNCLLEFLSNQRTSKAALVLDKVKPRYRDGDLKAELQPGNIALSSLPIPNPNPSQSEPAGSETHSLLLSSDRHSKLLLFGDAVSFLVRLIGWQCKLAIAMEGRVIKGRVTSMEPSSLWTYKDVSKMLSFIFSSPIITSIN